MNATRPHATPDIAAQIQRSPENPASIRRVQFRNPPCLEARAMTKFTLLSIPVLLCALSADGLPQRPTYPTPPPPLNTDNAPPTPAPETIRRRIDPVKLQREADDLARLAQTIPTDAASIRQGRLPKDVIQKLKQIEKLSKRLRGELTP